LISVSALFVITLVVFVLVCGPTSVIGFVTSFAIYCSSPLEFAKKDYISRESLSWSFSAVDIKDVFVAPVQFSEYMFQ
jgi:hypothetical protein